MSKPTVTTRHFPKKGERLIDGEWVMPAPPQQARQRMSAAEQRDWLRKQAGWPPIRIPSKEKIGVSK